MATGGSGTSKRTAAKKAPAKKVPANETAANESAATGPATPAKKVAKAAPAKKTAATKQSAGPDTATTPAADTGLAAMMATLPPAGEGIDPALKGPRSFHITKLTLARAQAAVHWLAYMAGTDEPDTVSELAEQGLLREVERLERAYNNGRPFPAIQGRMRPGPGSQGSRKISAFQEARRLGRTEGGGGDDDA